MMKNLRQSKGITLIALVITIIVLLILAGVAISMLTGENGIINRANSAKTELDQAERVEDEKLNDYEEIINNYTGGKKVPEELSKYILGQEGKGRNFDEIVDFATYSLKEDSLNPIPNIHEKIKFAYMREEEPTTLYIRYNRIVYKFDYIVNETTQLPEKSVKGTLLYVNEPEGNLGKYVTYNGFTWIVLRDDASGVELISAEGLGNLKIYSGSGKEDYNNAISTIVDKCKEITSMTTNIRNVGGPATEDNLSEINTVKFNDFNIFQPTVSYDNFAKHEGDINGIRKQDTNYLTDYDQMKKIGIVFSDNMLGYWLSSRHIEETPLKVYFNIRYIFEDIYSNTIYGVIDNSEEAYYNSTDTPRSWGIRPVIKLESGILNNKTQTGSIEEPIIL